MSWLNFFDGLEVNVESRLDGWLFGCHHNHLVIGIVKCRSDAGGITYHKGRTIANHSCHGVAPVKVTTRPTEYSSHI